MKKFREVLDPYRTLALVIIIILTVFICTVFIYQSKSKVDLQKAKVLEVLEVVDDQGLIYQNFLVSLEDQETKVQVQVPLSLPEVKSLHKGDTIYLQQIGDEATGVPYRYSSTDQTLKFFLILLIFCVFLIVVLGLKPLFHLFPASFFLIFLSTGVFNVSGEIRVVFISLLGLMIIVSFIFILWVHRDILLSILSALAILFSSIFAILLYILLINFTNTSEIVNFQQLFSKDLLIYDFSQAKVLGIVIIYYGLSLSLINKLIDECKSYLKDRKKTTRYKIIKYNLNKVQIELGKLLNLVFFLVLGLNFLGLVGEDLSAYNYVWNSSFFLGLIIDCIATACTLVVLGYIFGLFLALYPDWKDS